MSVRKSSSPLDSKLAQAVAADAKTYPDGNDPKKPELQVTRHAGWGEQTVRVACDYEVGVRNPKTGALETVVFKQVPQDRHAKWGLPGFDSTKDNYSKTLSCEGVDYKAKEYITQKGFLEVMSEPVAIQRFHVEKLPALKARVEHYEKTGETGNPGK